VSVLHPLFSSRSATEVAATFAAACKRRRPATIKEEVE
jgi:hypothetical protein